MRQYLVVANQTLGGAHLLSALQQRAAAGPCHIHVLVPAGPDPHGWSSDEAGDTAAAQRRLDAAMESMRSLGAEVSGEIGDPRPVDAVSDALRAGSYDEIILSTLPVGVSRWLRMDLLHRLSRAVDDVPITHIAAEHEPAP